MNELATFYTATSPLRSLLIFLQQYPESTYTGEIRIKYHKYHWCHKFSVGSDICNEPSKQMRWKTYRLCQADSYFVVVTCDQLKW